MPSGACGKVAGCWCELCVCMPVKLLSHRMAKFSRSFRPQKKSWMQGNRKISRHHQGRLPLTQKSQSAEEQGAEISFRFPCVRGAASTLLVQHTDKVPETRSRLSIPNREFEIFHTANLSSIYRTIGLTADWDVGHTRCNILLMFVSLAEPPFRFWGGRSSCREVKCKR